MCPIPPPILPLPQPLPEVELPGVSAANGSIAAFDGFLMGEGFGGWGLLVNGEVGTVGRDRRSSCGWYT